MPVTIYGNGPITGTTVTPTGVVLPYAGTTEPTGWLFCYGQAVSRTTYADLFTALGTTYGTGDGSTTFNLPDMRGRVAAGRDNMGGTAASRLTTTVLDKISEGGVGGAQTHTLTEAQMPSHAHNAGSLKFAQGDNNVGSSSNAVKSLNTGTYSGAMSGAVEGTGGGGAHNNTQPTIILNYIIKAV